MSNAPSADIAEFMQTNGIGFLAATTGWSIFESREPVSPDSTITVYDSGGLASNPAWILDFPSIQIRVRGDIGRYDLAYTKCQEIKDLLLGLPKQVINTTEYIGVWALGDITSLGYDDNKRPILVQNWRIAREPADGSPSTNRDPL
jgi:hypothetical protein